ncbi:hypothetical protein [Actinokineospora alba]|uniref:hypothetical protein n=1 Tax=Actinokineospora alba TaxID=504798 RepID=UPI001060C974|nr:hypothetical protein [Actinokineospora alba]
MSDEDSGASAAESASDLASSAGDRPGSFAFFSLIGDRFNAPGMPADTAKEVGFFREAILSVARQLWLDANLGRSRVPAGFAEAFDLRLTNVLRGSAEPQLLLNRTQRVSDEDWDEWVRFYEAARDSIAMGVPTVAVAPLDRDRTDLTEEARAARVLRNPAVVASLRKIGSTLEQAETVVLGSPLRAGPRVKLDHDMRLLLNPRLSDLGVTQSEQVSIEGVIVEYDGKTRSFRLEMLNGSATCSLTKDEARLSIQARDYLALDGFTAPDVVIIGETNNSVAKNIHIFSVHSIDIVRSVAEKMLIQQLQRIVELEDNWLGSGSEKPPEEIVERVRELVPALAALDIQISVVPSADGSVVLEARRGLVELSVAVEPNGEMFMCSDNVDTNELDEAQVDFDGSRLERFLRTGAIS